MELVYLWVEEYKNIQNQGFNFSPKFNCKYDPDTNKLTIDENDDYIENFFGENINVTAIVGKNGSGKSSILKSFDIWSSENIYYIFMKHGKLYSNYFKEYGDGNKIEKGNLEKIIYVNKLFFIELEAENLFNVKGLQDENLYAGYFGLSNNIMDITKFHNKILELIFQGRCLESIYFKPVKIKIKPNLTHKSFLSFNMKSLPSFTFYHYYKIYLKSLEIMDSTIDKDEQIALMQTFLDENSDDDILKFHYDIIYESENDIYNYLPDSNNSDSDIYDFLETIKNSKLVPINEFREDYLKDNMGVFSYLKRIGFLEYDLYDDLGKTFSSLSSGEKILFVDHCILNSNIEDINYSFKQEKLEVLILLDEPDITLHPDWQKKYVAMLLSLLQRHTCRKFHIIFTTHSPFLLSDIPKQNIIFLDKDAEGKCKVLTNDEVLNKKQTFGANIHTLLSDSFFMEDGLMGEFAKRKIDEIIDFHKKVEEENKKETPNLTILKTEYEEKKKHFWDIQAIIGEDYLKQVIKNHLVEIEKILLGKDAAKQEEIERTEKYLKSLKNDKS